MQSGFAQNEPLLLLSKKESTEIGSSVKEYAILDKSFRKAKQIADNALQSKMEVPIPVDNGGGYTHEKHKQNYRDMYAAGVVYSVTREKAYAEFVEKMLLEYARIYPSLPLHPQSNKDKMAGKLFWQDLNDCVWLVNSIQAYELVKANISMQNREIIERDVFRSMAAFISESEGRKEVFNWIHNHATWAVAAVGMTGYVLGDKDMVDRALYGSAKDGKTGFLKQVDELFSPDGYYSEGPYYQRYALQPFLVFAEAINRNQPGLDIFGYRNGVLGKSVKTMFDLTDENGLLLPFNDALKEKDVHSEELVIAADIAYENYHDASLLPIIKSQDEVMVSGAGFAAAKDIANAKAPQYRTSQLVTDGADGKSGGIALLKSDNKNGGQFNLIFKYASQGLNHGHFDRLGIQLYDGKNEILQDYGAVRFINIEAKNGGRYLKEDDTYAKQSIAHNTVTVDEVSQYGANLDAAGKTSPQFLFADLLEPNEIQIVSAQENKAYPGVTMRRTLAMIGGKRPFIIDIFALHSAEKHQYDLNFMYSGQIMETDFEYDAAVNSLNILGPKNGYEHIWKLAQANGNNGISTFTWLDGRKFYSISTITDTNTELLFTKSGANDPNFDLRNEPGYLIRNKGKDNYTFVSVIEPHGSFEPVPELVADSHSAVREIKLRKDDSESTVISVIFNNGKTYLLLLAAVPNDKATHKVILDGKPYHWQGNYKLIEN
jgi:hypothetical protein